MKTKLTFLFVALCCAASADTVVDSTNIHNTIVGVVNPIVQSVPDVNQGVSIIKAAMLAFGGAITGWCIHFFAKKKKK